MAKCIIEKTTNIYELYRHVCGKTEVPDILNFWALTAVISAALGDRCWVNIYRNLPLRPNLYVGFIGGGSIGKGLAISNAVDLLQDATETNMFRGRLTHAHLIDLLGKPYYDELTNETRLPETRLFLVMDELRNGVGSNRQMADEIIGMLTELYTASNYPLDTGTRAHGIITVDKSCLSWLFGSTAAWLKDVLSAAIFESGFIARCCFIKTEKDYGKRVMMPLYPEDCETVYKYLVYLFSQMVKNYRGAFSISEKAMGMMTDWYENRAEPSDKLMESIWGRQYELLIRFCMIQCAADGKDMIIRPKHVKNSFMMLQHVYSTAESLLTDSTSSWGTRLKSEVLSYIRSHLWVKHCDVTHFMSTRRGATAKPVKAAIAELIEEGFVILRRDKSTRGVLYKAVKPKWSQDADEETNVEGDSC